MKKEGLAKQAIGALSLLTVACLIAAPAFREVDYNRITLSFADQNAPIEPSKIFTGVKGIKFQKRRWFVSSLPGSEDQKRVLLLKRKGTLTFDANGKILRFFVFRALEGGQLKIFDNQRRQIVAKNIASNKETKINTPFILEPKTNRITKQQESEVYLEYSEPASLFITEISYLSKKPKRRHNAQTPTPTNAIPRTPRPTATTAPGTTLTPSPTSTSAGVRTPTPTPTSPPSSGTPTPTSTPSGGTIGGVELPRAYVDSSYPTLGAGHTVRTVKANCSGIANCYTNFQSALDAVLPGEEVMIDAGLTLTAPSGGFVLKAKTNPSNAWIIVRSANTANLPSGNSRISSSHAAQMPKIVTADNLAAISTASGAHHYYLSGIEVTISDSSILTDALNSNYNSNSGLIMLGSVYESVLANQAHHINFDRCYVHGSSTKNTRRGFFLNSRDTAIVNSHMSQFNDVGADSQAILGANGSGPYKIFNNYIEAAGENILLGGVDAIIPDVMPSDIEIRNNHITKPLSWRQGTAGYAGYPWVVKNLLEIKYGKRVLIEGNVIENNWAAAQSGMALNIKTVNQDGSMTWAITENITVTNNIIRHAALGVTLVNRDNNGPSGTTNNVRIANNLFDDISASGWGGGSGGTFVLLLGAPNMKLDHNTVLNDGTTISVDGVPANGFVFTNNIAFLTAYGIKGSGAASGNPTISTWMPNSTFSKNAFVGDGSGYPSNNYYPSTVGAVGFANYSNGNYALSNSSSYLNAGTDNKNVGADMGAVNSATSCALGGAC